MSDDLVLCATLPGGVATLRLNRPPMNPLSKAMLGAIAEAAAELAADETVKAVVVLGSEKALAAGADIKEFGDQAAARTIGAAFRRAFDGIAAIPRPVIAGIRGFALGGGMELALACDLRVAAETARLGQPEILLGIIPGAGGTQRLPRLVGPACAKELIWSGRQVKAAEALAIGLVDRVVPAEELESATLAWATELAGGAVGAMGLAKRAIDDGLDAPLARGLDTEADAFVEVFGTDDAAVGVASFLEHGPGKAVFSGR
jgi:enoyl-CoA hydratase/carnithine racemase